MAGDQPDWTGTTASLPQQLAYTAERDNAGSLGAGLLESIVFLAPTGTFVTLAGIYFFVQPPPGASSGTHYLKPYIVTSGGSAFLLIYGESNDTDNLEYATGYWTSATKTMDPPSTQPQAWYAGKVGFDDTNGFEIQYTNGTNVAQSNPRTYIIAGIETVYQA